MGEHKQYKAKPIDWHVAADRLTVGEAVELKTLPGLHIKPRKYSVAGAATIAAAQTHAIAQMRGEALLQVAGMYDESDDSAGGVSSEQQREIALHLLENMTPDVIGSLEEKKAKLVYGIEEHDFAGVWARPTEAWAAEVMQHPDVFAEVFAIVEEKNSPLAATPPSNSGTSPTGTSTESDTEGTKGSSPTEQTP
jgi:hypothetical protein